MKWCMVASTLRPCSLLSSESVPCVRDTQATYTCDHGAAWHNSRGTRRSCRQPRRRRDPATRPLSTTSSTTSSARGGNRASSRDTSGGSALRFREVTSRFLAFFTSLSRKNCSPVLLSLRTNTQTCRNFHFGSAVVT